MARKGQRFRHFRAIILVALCLAALALLLARCPANRDGMPGQLATAMEETVAAARSGALALDLRLRDRSTANLTSVQVSDARDQVVKAYQGVADLKADDPTDIARQKFLTESMTTIIGQLNAASATMREITTTPEVPELRDDLLASADALESGYR